MSLAQDINHNEFMTVEQDMNYYIFLVSHVDGVYKACFSFEEAYNELIKMYMQLNPLQYEDDLVIEERVIKEGHKHLPMTYRFNVINTRYRLAAEHTITRLPINIPTGTKLVTNI